MGGESADRVAFLVTGDLWAGLRTLAPGLTAIEGAAGVAARTAALGAPGALRELIAYALSAEALARLGGLG